MPIQSIQTLSCEERAVCPSGMGSVIRGKACFCGKLHVTHSRKIQGVTNKQWGVFPKQGQGSACGRVPVPTWEGQLMPAAVGTLLGPAMCARRGAC